MIDNFNRLEKIMESKILFLDGAMGTMIQALNLTEADFVGSLSLGFKQKGNNDLLCLTCPEHISNIHRAYLTAGADIIETNTFNANSISQADYGAQEYVYDINLKAAQIAKACALEFIKTNPNKPRFVAGSIGPSNKALSISPDVDNPAARSIDFDSLCGAYQEQVQALIEGGVDILLIETITDSLNAKAALLACEAAFEKLDKKLPIMLSLSIVDKSGRSLSGQNIEAFLISMENDNVISLGLNCSFGADDLLAYIKEMSRLSDKFISIHPNAGLPNELGEYMESPEHAAKTLYSYANEAMFNIVGGCCGTGPAHISAIVEKLGNCPPHKRNPKANYLQLAGLEALNINSNLGFLNIGERCNVAGSMKFARLIANAQYEKAIEIAKAQVESGALVIDINMDDSLLDAKKEMDHFLKLIATEPDIAKVPVMIDSSNFDIILCGLKAIQGKPIVNSISLKEGKEAFVKKANIIKNFGAAVVIMAFDEKGQATDYIKKIEIAQRAYKILVDELGFNPCNIIFDLNILAIGTGIKEHNRYAIDYIEAIKYIKHNLPYAYTSGGLSNLSFSFRGNNPLREAMHSAFLYHAIKAGLDMAILNPEMITLYEDIEPSLLLKLENLIFDRHAKACDELIEYFENRSEHIDNSKKSLTKVDEDKFSYAYINSNKPHENLIYSLVHGMDSGIERDLDILLQKKSPMLIIDQSLMNGMSEVGCLFGEGKMFLPQVVKSARLMKKAVAYLMPYITGEQSNKVQRAKILIATVKGDVHDIGKNIVKVVLECNDFELVDLGIMVEADLIVEEAIKHNVDIIALSGLITPSLNEMLNTIKNLENAGLQIPILIGGASTSQLHTALRIVPETNLYVIQCADAAYSAEAAKALMDKKSKALFLKEVYDNYNNIRENYQKQEAPISYKLAMQNIPKFDFSKKKTPKFIGVKKISFNIDTLMPYINYQYLFHTWGINISQEKITKRNFSPVESSLLDDALDMLNRLKNNPNIYATAVICLSPAYSSQNDIYVVHEGKQYVFYNFRQQKGDFLCISDFVAPPDNQGRPQDYIGGFVVSAGNELEIISNDYSKNGDDYNSLLVKSIAICLCEAMSEKAHELYRTEIYAYEDHEKLSNLDLFACKYRGIRPAIGYPQLINHREKLSLFKWLKAEENMGISLTKSYMMIPAASECGLYIGHEFAKYFDVGLVDNEQLHDYSMRSGIEEDELIDLIKTRHWNQSSSK